MFIKLFASLLVCCTAFALDEPSSFEPFTGKVTRAKVRLRTAPNLEGHVIRETSLGELFAVVGENQGFYAVTPPQNTKGYVFRTYILDGVVEGQNVNIRLYPDIDAPIVGKLHAGDKVNAKVSDINNKWLEVDLPQDSHFYLAHEFCEKIGPVDLITKIEAKHKEATHHLHAAFHYAQSEIQKPLQEIDLDSINSRLQSVASSYYDFPEIVVSVTDVSNLIQEIYVQKKIAFLESKADQKAKKLALDPTHVEKLAKYGIRLSPMQEEKGLALIGEASATTIGLATSFSDDAMTDKMRIWQPLEESIYHLWAAVNSDRGHEEFYKEEADRAVILTGIIEPYNRPVKNLPGDYLLRADNQPVAFLYSTKINLQNYVGQSVTLQAAPRDNNHFAFPAYFVLTVK